MPLPALLTPGNIPPQKWMTSEQRMALSTQKPIEWVLDYLESRMSINGVCKFPPKNIGGRICLFEAKTGTGKSTVLPAELYKRFKDKIKKTIICVQPTIITTIDIPKSIIKNYPEIKMGVNIGYQTGPMSKKTTESGILFMTNGVLLQRLKSSTDEDIMKKFSFIIIDEVHKRSIDIDSILYYVKNFLEKNYKNENCPTFILASGTMDYKFFGEYFGCPENSHIMVAGISHPIADHYTKFTVTNYIKYIAALICRIHHENIATINSKYSEILVFLPGGATIKQLHKEIMSINMEIKTSGFEVAMKNNSNSTQYESKEKMGGSKSANYLLPIALLSDVIEKNGDDYKNIHLPIANVEMELDGKKVKPSRKVIMATNVVETGITIPNLGYCIDAGFSQEMKFYPGVGINCLVLQPISRDNVLQRRGRVGREQPGDFYAVYPEEIFAYMNKQSEPEILKTELTTMILNYIIKYTDSRLVFKYLQNSRVDAVIEKSCNFNFNDINLITNPPIETLLCALYKLQKLGFLDNNYNPTIFGLMSARIKMVSFESIRMILAGFHRGAYISDLVTIAAFIKGSEKLYLNKREKPRLSNISRKFSGEILRDELIEYLYLWDSIVKNASKLEKWAEDNNLNYGTINKIIAMRDEIIHDMVLYDINVNYNSMGLKKSTYNLPKIVEQNRVDGVAEIAKIKECIYEGYKLNMCVYDEVGDFYRMAENGKKIIVDSPYTNYKPRPKYIICGSIMMRAKSDKILYEIKGEMVSVLDCFVEIEK
jgi:HrpA-like RNA helicase